MRKHKTPKGHQDRPRGNHTKAMSVMFLLCALFLATGCGPGLIQGTEVPATKKNRAIYAVVQRYHELVVKGRWKALLQLVSPRYHETRGTSDPADDYGYGELRQRLESAEFQQIRVLRFSFAIEKMKHLKHNEVEVYLKTWHSYRYPRGKYRPGFDAGPKRYVLLFEYNRGRWLIRRGL